ncbi:hypothetical protein CBG57_11590 [Prevotella nigrescens]|nr:hypothetical protein CBG57_11590 [Prevotella nigrescens]
MWCQLQPNAAKEHDMARCDLLKKLYLCGVNYNCTFLVSSNVFVVICLKSCIFVVSITTIKPTSFAIPRCDLLKKLYLCGVNYNTTRQQYHARRVVICLKSCIFVVSITTLLASATLPS